MISFELLPLLYLALSATPGPTPSCSPPNAKERVLLLVVSSDPGLRSAQSRAQRAMRSLGAPLNLLPPKMSVAAMTVEGGRALREQTVLSARAIVVRAEERFRELEDELALQLIAKATTQLASIHQEPGAIELLARAHLLAGAIYLARDRLVAARRRQRRALDLQPDLTPARHRFAPQVLSEIAALKSAAAVRSVGRLEIRAPQGPGAMVFLDGQPKGPAPVVLDSIGVGRHLLRVSASGFRSHIASVRVEALNTKKLVVQLSPDEELQKLQTLPGWLRLARPAEPVLGLLAKRVDADRTLLMTLTLSGQGTGTATVGAVLQMQGAGQAYAASLQPAHLRAALQQALRCQQSQPPALAPALIGAAPLRLDRPGPVPPPTPWWERSWFWGAAAIVFISASAAFVVGRTSGGPPEALEITLKPRP